MAISVANRVRIDRSCRELQSLRGAIEAWITGRIDRDKLHKHQTQLDQLSTALLGPLAQVEAKLGALDAESDEGTVYEGCRRFDRGLALIRRVWSYYRPKFEQRDDVDLGMVLAAADEVVWSCYKEAFEHLPPGPDRAVRGSAPLPYVEAVFAPEAILRDEPPPELRSDGDDVTVGKFLAKLAVPVVGLPPTCAQDPWWLVHLAHEVGHHLQVDLVAEWELVATFGSLLRNWVTGGDDPRLNAGGGDRWYRWGREIFADACAVHAVGTAAIRGILELEMNGERAMLARMDRYPPPVVRLALMARLAEELGLDSKQGLGGFDPASLVSGSPIMSNGVDLRAHAAQDMGVVPKVARAVATTSLGGLGTLREVFGWDAEKDPACQARDIERWRDGLLSGGGIGPEGTLQAARRAVAGAVGAWVTLSGEADDAAREKVRAELAHRVLATVAASREEGTRAADPQAIPKSKPLVDELTSLIIEIQEPEG